MKSIILGLIGVGIIIGMLIMTIVFIIGLKIEEIVKRRNKWN